MEIQVSQTITAFVRLFFCFGCMLIGAAGWIALERFEQVPPMCLIDSKAYDSLATKR